MCARRTAWDWCSAGGFTVLVLLCQRCCAQGRCLSLSYVHDIILWNPFNQSPAARSCRVCWRWSWRCPPTALTPTVWRCWGDCGWPNLMWRRRVERWRRSESCSFSAESHFHTTASGAGPNGSLVVLKLLCKFRCAAENNTQVRLKTCIWEMVHHVDSSAVHGCYQSKQWTAVDVWFLKLMFLIKCLIWVNKIN